MEELSQQTKNILEQEKKPIQEDTFFDKYIAGEKTKGMFNPTARDVVDTATDFIPGVSETKDIISLGTNVGKGEYKAAGIDLASLVLGVVPVVGDVARKGFRALVKNEDIVSKQADEVGESLQKIVGDVKSPEKTVKAYKLFKTDKKGDLYPLFVKMKDNKPLELNKWTKAEAGELNPKTGKVKSSLGDLAYRPGFHGGDLPIATHIGGKKGKVTKPNYRKDNQVWAEVEFGNDVDWQSIANSRAVRNKDGSVQVKTAHITDQVPERGHYRYKTNPNMTGNWLIGGELKINRVLSDKEVKSINDKAGVADLPRLKDLNLKESKKLSKGGDIVDKDVEKAAKPKMRPSNQMELFTYLKDNPDVKGMKEIELDRMRGIITDDDPRAPINTEGLKADIVRQRVLEREELLRDIDKYREGRKELAKGGSMPKQMELFSEGGLKDEGGTVDPVSGNDVPPGSTQEEVRDDIPARLSEGEFVFPADVVRYIGLEKLMMMRQEAKAGLKRMEEMGQMGNSDEATLPDDIPFTMDDLDMADDTIEANIGTFVPPKMPTATPYNPNVNPYTPTGVVPTTYAPYKPATGTSLLGASTQGVPETENRRYVNKTTGQVRMIPFNKATGQSLYPIPEGFVFEPEAPKEEAKTTKVQTTKVKPVDTGDDSQDQIDREREEAMYGPGGGRISLGGDIASKTTMVGTGVKSRQLKGSVVGSTTFGIGYTLPGGVIPGATAIQAIQAGMGNVPKGGTGKFTLNGVTVTKSAEVTNAIIKNPRGKEARALIDQHREMIKSRDYFADKYNVTTKDAREIVEGFQSDNPNIEDKDRMVDVIDRNIREGNISADQLGDEKNLFSTYQSSAIDKEDRERATKEQRAAEKATGMSFADLVAQTGGDDSSDDFSDFEGFDAESDNEDTFNFNQGGLAGKKKKAKLKKMKRGGLASR